MLPVFGFFLGLNRVWLQSRNFLVLSLLWLFVVVVKQWKRLCHEAVLPGPISFTVESEMSNDILEFKVNLDSWPDPDDTDVVSGELEVEVDGAVVAVREVPFGEREVTGLEGPENSFVRVTFAFVDNAGNRSNPPAEASGQLTDTIDPPTPGQLSFMVTGERHVAADPDPDPDPDPIPDPGPQA